MVIIKTFATRNAFVEESAEFMADDCRTSNEIPVRIIVSGGGTPMPVYTAFSKKKDVPFEKVEFFQADERYVPPTHPESNFTAIQNALGAKVMKRIASFHRFNTIKQIDEALDEYEKKLKNIPFFNLAVLGIGSDGHIASLFPHSRALHEKKRLTVHTITHKFAVKDRLTLTFPVLFTSKKILVLLEGKIKKNVLAELSSPTKPSLEFPALSLLAHPDLTIYYCQEAPKTESHKPKRPKSSAR